MNQLHLQDPHKDVKEWIIISFNKTFYTEHQGGWYNEVLLYMDLLDRGIFGLGRWGRTICASTMLD